ncbi:MAG: YqhG family protein [Bacillus sp. (in: firmicutes)]
MQQHEIHHFLYKFFSVNGAQLLVNHPAYMTVLLTVELDKTLMNRPFYWHYLEKTGGEPKPATLTLITDPNNVPENVSGEIIYFGSPRLHQIFQSTKKLGNYIRLYESCTEQPTHTPLHPWLATNVKVSFQCDRKKDLFFSLGLHLLSGKIIEDFHQKILSRSLTPKIPDFAFTLSPLIMPKSGLSRLDRYVRLQLENENYDWAEKAINKWTKDLQLLEHFYEDMENKGENYELEKKALQEQYEPKIKISIINGGMFYLNEQTI